MKYLLILVIALLVQGCATLATIEMVPQDVSEIDFDAPEGKTGWSQYTHVEKFRGYNANQIYEAAKVRLDNKFCVYLWHSRPGFLYL